MNTYERFLAALVDVHIDALEALAASGTLIPEFVTQRTAELEKEHVLGEEQRSRLAQIARMAKARPSMISRN